MAMPPNNLQQNPLGLTPKPALLLVDMINGFTDPACALGTACSEVVAANVQLLEAFRALGLPVFFTTVVYHSEQQAEVFRRKVPALNVLQPNSHWVKVDSALEPLEGEPVIEKQWASAFFCDGSRSAVICARCGFHRCHRFNHQWLCARLCGGWVAE